MADNILVMDHITKEFPGVKALDNVNLEVQRGEIHALLGEKVVKTKRTVPVQDRKSVV